MKPTHGFYVTGGTLPRTRPPTSSARRTGAVRRPHARGEFCYVLTSRQMGKSSLMVRTAARLRAGGRRGRGPRPHRHRPEPLRRAVVRRACCAASAGSSTWKTSWRSSGWQHERARPAAALDGGAAARWCCPRSRAALVIFIDEIDAVRSLPFSTDEFFAAIRECYNRRSRGPGVRAAHLLPAGRGHSLGPDPGHAHHPVQHRPAHRADRLHRRGSGAAGCAGLGRERAERVQRRRCWSGCSVLDRRPSLPHPAPLPGGGRRRPIRNRKIQNPKSEVDRLCEELFLSPGAREQDDNLLFVRERLLRSEADRAACWTCMGRCGPGKRVRLDDTNPLVDLLRLSGITRAMDGPAAGAQPDLRAGVRPAVGDASTCRTRSCGGSGRRTGGVCCGPPRCPGRPYRDGRPGARGAAPAGAAREPAAAGAEARRWSARRNLYAAQMNLAQQAWERATWARAGAAGGLAAPAGPGGPARLRVALPLATLPGRGRPHWVFMVPSRAHR